MCVNVTPKFHIMNQWQHT